jgi:hypothetical protein
MRGDIFFRTKLLGSSLMAGQFWLICGHESCVPRNVRRIEGAEANSVLMVGHVSVGLQTENLRVSHVGTIDERAEEQQCQDGQYPARVSALHRLTTSRPT